MKIFILFLLLFYFVYVLSNCIPQNCIGSCINNNCCLPWNVCNKTCCESNQSCSISHNGTKFCDCIPFQVCGNSKICCSNGQICNLFTNTCDCSSAYCNSHYNGSCISSLCCYPKSRVCGNTCCPKNYSCISKRCIHN